MRCVIIIIQCTHTQKDDDAAGGLNGKVEFARLLSGYRDISGYLYGSHRLMGAASSGVDMAHGEYIFILCKVKAKGERPGKRIEAKGLHYSLQRLFFFNYN